MSPISSGDSKLLDVTDTIIKSLLLLLLLLLKIRTAIDDIEAGFVIGSGQQQVA